MNRINPIRTNTTAGVPHACGDEPVVSGLVVAMTACSPRMRGMNRHRDKHRTRPARVPHACGDEPVLLDAAVPLVQGVPHACGDEPTRAIS